MNDTVPKKSNDNLKKSNDLIDLWSIGTMFSLLLVIGFILITCSLSMFHISCMYVYLHVQGGGGRPPCPPCAASLYMYVFKTPFLDRYRFGSVKVQIDRSLYTMINFIFNMFYFS